MNFDDDEDLIARNFSKAKKLPKMDMNSEFRNHESDDSFAREEINENKESQNDGTLTPMNVKEQTEMIPSQQENQMSRILPPPAQYKNSLCDMELKQPPMQAEYPNYPEMQMHKNRSSSQDLSVGN